MEDEVQGMEAGEESNSEPTEIQEQDENASLASEVEASEEQPEEPSRLQKLIASKGGEDKFVDSIYEGYNSMSKMAKRLEAIEGMMTQKNAPPENEIPDSPDYQWLKAELGTIEEDLKETAAARDQVVNAFQTTREKLIEAKVKGDAALAGRLEDKLENLNDKYLQLQREEKKLQSSKGLRDLQLKNAEAQLQRARGLKLQQAREDALETQNFRQEFDTEVVGLLRRSGLSNADQEDLYETVRLKAHAYVEKNGMVPSLAALGKEIASRELSRIKSANFRALSADKVQASAKTTQPITQTSQPSKKTPSVKRAAQPQGDEKPKMSRDEALARIKAWTG